MRSIPAGTLTPAQLAPMLRAWADGAFASEAAVELVIAHRHWLTRRDFCDRLIDAVEDGWGRGGTIVPMATVDWDQVPQFLDDVPSSSSERAMLLFAASLAGGVPGGSLLAMTERLDDTNATLVLQALAHRFGWHERGTAIRVDGVLPEAREARDDAVARHG